MNTECPTQPTNIEPILAVLSSRFGVLDAMLLLQAKFNQLADYVYQLKLTQDTAIASFDHSEMFNVSRAASYLGVSKRAVYFAAKAGRLRLTPIWLDESRYYYAVSRASCDVYRASRGAAFRGPRQRSRAVQQILNPFDEATSASSTPSSTTSSNDSRDSHE